MSLASILQGYANDLTAKENHNTENEQEISDRKANTIEEQFQNHIDHITSGAADLGGASTAFHLGRKVYKAYRDAKSGIEAKKAEIEKAKSNAGQGKENPSGENGDAVKPNPQGDADPVRNAGGGDAIAENNGASSELDNRVSEVQQRFRDLKAKLNAPTEGASGSIEEQTAAKTAAGQPIKSTELPYPEVEPLSQSGATISSSNTGASAGQASAPQQASQADVSAEADSSQARSVAPAEPKPEQSFLGREGSPNTGQGGGGLEQAKPPNPNQGGGGKPADPAPASEPNAQTTSVDSQVGKQATNPAEMSNVGADSENVIKSSVMDDAGNMARQVGGKLANTAKALVPDSVNSALDTGLITTDAVLDSVPVVGEVASVITGLIGLFEGIGHKNDPDKETTAVGAPATATTGIDPQAVAKAQAPQTTATIV
tara:strand:+ start:15626 stop:16915 length:1290 start_codon:yes stop_codon:yes gene_type:complete